MNNVSKNSPKKKNARTSSRVTQIQRIDTHLSFRKQKNNKDKIAHKYAINVSSDYGDRTIELPFFKDQ